MRAVDKLSLTGHNMFICMHYYVLLLRILAVAVQTT